MDCAPKNAHTEPQDLIVLPRQLESPVECLEAHAQVSLAAQCASQVDGECDQGAVAHVLGAEVGIPADEIEALLAADAQLFQPTRGQGSEGEGSHRGAKPAVSRPVGDLDRLVEDGEGLHVPFANPEGTAVRG